jgi:hypothetical protein
LGIGWGATDEGKAFVLSMKAAESSGSGDPPWNYLYEEGADYPEVEAFAELCRAWYLPDPGGFRTSFDIFPPLRAFADKWLPRTTPAPLAVRAIVGQYSNPAAPGMGYHMTACPDDGMQCYGTLDRTDRVFRMLLPPGIYRLRLNQNDHVQGYYRVGGITQIWEEATLIDTTAQDVTGILVVIP